MATKDKEATGSSSVQSGISVAPGKIFIELCVNSSVVDHEVRKGLRKAFGEKMLEMTGGKISTGDLAAYMMGALTADHTVPSSADLMLIELNREGGYLEKIVKKCGAENEVPLSGYEAKMMQGVDSYCVGGDGKIRCYHFFNLVSKTGTGGPITVEYKNEMGVLAFCCAGQSVS